MSSISAAGAAWLRDHVIAGLPASGENKPDKAEGRALMTMIEAALSTLGLAGGIAVAYATRGLLNADLAHDANTLAVVYSDPTSAQNGIYVKAGASGAGSWIQTEIALPASFATDIATALAGLETIEAAVAATEADRVQTAADREATAAAIASALTLYGSAEAIAEAVADAQSARDSAQIDAAATAADRVQTGVDRAATEAAAAEGAASLSQNLLLALAATGALLAAYPSDLSAAPSPFIVPEAPGLQLYTHDGSTATAQGFVGRATFAHVSTMKAYALALGPVGTRVEAGRHRYEVVSSGEHLTTAGGVKLIVLPGPRGYEIEAFGIDLTNTTGMSAALAAADAVAAAAGQPLVGTPGTVKLNASIDHNAVVITHGIKFHFEGGVVQTFKNQFFAGREEVFVGSVGASVGPRWSAGTIDAIFPEWFGAKAYDVVGGTPFDSAPAFLRAHQAAGRILGFAYQISCGQGIYGFASGVDVPSAGECDVVGQGPVNTQFRAINGGSGFPDYIYKFTTSTTNSRLRGIYWYGGSSSRPTKYGVQSLEMKHTHADECLFSSFDIAAFTSPEWDNQLEDCEFSFCHVGFWAKRSGGNNNDLNLDTCRFVSCEMAVVLNAGTACRIRNGQFQAALVAPFTKGFVYVQGVAGFSFDNNYVETQATGGLKGMAFTVPTAWNLRASLIFNLAPYFTDEVGTVTSTLSQNSSSLGTVGSVTDNLFATPAYYQAGAGSFGYAAGAVTFQAITGTGTGASGTVTVQDVGGVSGIVTSATPGAGAAGGTKFMIGDIVGIVQGGVTGAIATVLTTGANNSIASLYIGDAAAIYPGHVRRLSISGNVFSPSCAILALYNDRTVCDPQKLELRQNVRQSTGIVFQMIGPLTDTVNVQMGNITISDALYDAAPNLGLSRRNYKPDSWAFASGPTKSVFTRSSGRHKGYPWYKLKLLPGETVTDVLEFSVTIGSSGPNNAELIGQMVYLSAFKLEGQANTRLRMALEMVNGTDTLVRQNYGTGGGFTKTAGESREEASLVVGSLGGTLKGKIQVVSASAVEQEVNFGGVILTIAGVSVDLFDIASFERPLTGSVNWTPGPISAGATATVTLPCLGARAGDLVLLDDSNADMSDLHITRKAVTNGIEVHARNLAAVTKGGWTQAMRWQVHPST